MKKIVSIMIMMFMFRDGAAAQLQSIRMYGNSEFSVANRSGVKSAFSYGGGLNVDFSVGGNFIWTLDIGYANYSIDQDNEVAAWGWAIWDRRYRNWVNIYSSDTANYRSSIVAVQTMETIPVTMKIGYDFHLTPSIRLSPVAGIGAEFYTRKLYHEETWTRRYPQENYEFTYSYHNFAPYKYGNPIIGIFGIDGAVVLSRLITVEAGASYKTVLETKGSFGYDNYPLNSILSLKAGIGFHY